MMNEIQTGQKPTATSEVGAKAGFVHMIPAHGTTKGVGRLPKPCLGPDPPTCSTPPHLRDQPAVLGQEQGHLLLVVTPSRYSTSPSKALLEPLIWPLINFCRLKNSRTRVSNTSASPWEAHTHPRQFTLTKGSSHLAVCLKAKVSLTLEHPSNPGFSLSLSLSHTHTHLKSLFTLYIKSL